jgi:UDP-N-acetylmuramate dehydrogenase
MRTLTDLSAVPYSTFRFEARLSRIIECDSIADLQAFNIETPPVILGEGSNTVFMQNLTAPICRYVANQKYVTELGEQFVLVHVEAGHNWHHLVSWAVQHKYWGIENLALIPGSVGAAPVQNIGAYGTELADVCLYVDFFHWQLGKVQRIAAGRCQFGYRDSIFKQALAGKGVIVAVGLCLGREAAPSLGYKGLDHLPENSDIKTIYQQVINVRSSKLPDPATLANCGSFFKNPLISAQHYLSLQTQFGDIPGFAQADNKVKVPAAWLIDQQGFKGYKQGDVGCYHLQPLVLVNYGRGNATELTSLITTIQQKVLAVYAIQLEPEVRMLDASGRLYD